MGTKSAKRTGCSIGPVTAKMNANPSHFGVIATSPTGDSATILSNHDRLWGKCLKILLTIRLYRLCRWSLFGGGGGDGTISRFLAILFTLWNWFSNLNWFFLFSILKDFFKNPGESWSPQQCILFRLGLIYFLHHFMFEKCYWCKRTY